MADGIVDNSPEMPLDDPRVAEFLAKAQGDPVKPQADSEGVKPKPAASPAPVKPDDKSDDESEDETAEQLKAQRDGLKAELARRKGNSDQVEALRAELAAVKEKLAKPTENEFSWIVKLDNDALASKQTDWDDELADARSKYGRAEEAGDERAMERQGQRILQAKKTLSAFRRETLDRTKRNQDEAEELRTQTQSIRSEIDAMRDTVETQLPDLLDHDSALWKAGNEEFNAHPELMARLGPLAEIVAAAMAVVRNPDLRGGKSTSKVRKEVISNLDKGIKRSLSTGASAPTTSRAVDYSGAINSGDDLMKFNAMIDKFKGG